jgi:4-amino-4-deoxy-L-arabinose transferase-like glycosyltransferase
MLKSEDRGAPSSVVMGSVQLERQDAFIWGMRPVTLACLIVGVLTFFRLWYCTRLDLIPDEAYYWVWGKHFALAYRDKGPLAAWAIALSTKLLGDTVFGVRIFAVLLSAGTAFQLYRLAQRLYDERVALWCLIVAAAIPLFGVGSILMTIDPLSVFFWAWAVNLSWSGFETGRMRHWLLLGAVIGIGFLAKFINAMQLVCLGIFLCWSKPHRHYLFSRQSLATLVTFVIFSLPVIIWNAQTGWLHLHVLSERGGLDQSVAIRPANTLQYLAGQLGVLTPWLLVGMVIAVIALWRTQSDQARIKHLLSQYVPIQVMYLILSLNSKVQPNWIAPSLITGIVLLVVFWKQFAFQKVGWQRVVQLSLAVSLAITVFLHATPFLPIPRKIDVFHKAEGWADFAQRVEKYRRENRADLLIASYYTQASMMQFYMPDHPVTYLPPARWGTTQFTLWPGYNVEKSTRALYVDGDCKVSRKVKEQFNHCELVDEFSSEFRGRPIERFFVFILWND